MSLFTKYGDIFSLRLLDICELDIEVPKREDLSTSRIDQLGMVVAQWFDVLQLLEPLLLLDILWAGECIDADMLPPTLRGQVGLRVLRFERVRASVEVGAEDLERGSAHDGFVSQLPTTAWTK